MKGNQRIGPDAISRTGFTLIELLIVVAIIALLVAILLPSLGRARRQARIVKAHAELRLIAVALDAYAMDNEEKLPPTRADCSTTVSNQLPVELARQGFVPSSGQGEIPAGDVEDEFEPGMTYKYKAPGPLIQNGVLLLPKAGRLFVPDDFPRCESEEGAYYNDPRESPVRYAIWSIGPDRDSPKFTSQIARMPVPRRFWCTGAADTGVITHFSGRRGLMCTSP